MTRQKQQNRRMESILFATNANTSSSRRSFLVETTTSIVAATTFLLNPDRAIAKTAPISPDEAYQQLLSARGELLSLAQNDIPKSNVAGIKALVMDPKSYVNKLDTSMQILLDSKALDAESKKAIGTIRTYGVGADVMIMYGGLKAEFIPNTDEGMELDDDEDESGTQQPNWGEVSKYLSRTLDSLQEVIVICRSNGFEKKKK